MDTPFETADVSYRYIVGIDLGTTNSALAYVDLTGDGSESRQIRFLDILQLTAPGELSRRPILPSFLYLPGPYELPTGSTSLPDSASCVNNGMGTAGAAAATSIPS